MLNRIFYFLYRLNHILPIRAAEHQCHSFGKLEKVAPSVWARVHGLVN